LPSDPAAQRHLETAGGAFVLGYNTALEEIRQQQLALRLQEIEPLYRGFAFEGAAMALALLDLVTPWNRTRLPRLLDSPDGDAHLYMIHIGAGWAVARIPWARRKFEQAMASYHPLYRWLALDGYGFHQGFFDAPRFVRDQYRAPGLSAHAARVFDQGLGRSLWFSQGADVRRIALTVAAFPASRHSDLWSGAGLAASYAGGVSRGELDYLRDQAAEHAAQLAQGAAFAAKARQRAGNPQPHTQLACDIFCQMPAEDAAAVTDQHLPTLEYDGPEPAYLQWRAKISASFSLAKPAPHPTMAGMARPA
jgi:hypothetical protein